MKKCDLKIGDMIFSCKYPPDIERDCQKRLCVQVCSFSPYSSSKKLLFSFLPLFLQRIERYGEFFFFCLYFRLRQAEPACLTFFHETEWASLFRFRFLLCSKKKKIRFPLPFRVASPFFYFILFFQMKITTVPFRYCQIFLSLSPFFTIISCD